MPQVTVSVSMLCKPPIPLHTAEQVGQHVGPLESLRWRHGDPVTCWTWRVEVPRSVTQINAEWVEAATVLAIHEKLPEPRQLMLVGLDVAMDPADVVLPDAVFGPGDDEP